jgi:large subunit ribosomal protein L24
MKYSKTVSKKPAKKRKALYTASLHEARRALRCTLSDELRKKLKARSALVGKGDRVRIMRGSNKKAAGKVVKVDYKKRVVFVEGISAEHRKSKKQSLLPFDSSNLEIVERAEKRPAAKTPQAEPKKAEEKKQEKTEKPQPAKDEPKL